MEMRLRIPLQYWMLERRGMNLSFNSPWDGDPSASILEDPRDPSIQAFTHACAERAERELRALLVREDIQRTWEEIASLGGSQQLLIVVNQAPSGTQLRDLQALDRAPEMWFWNQDDKRPQLAFALWNRGSFVYEVAASPENCWMVPEENLTDLLQYAAKRLSRRKAS
jgi:hypothetical protein